MPSDGLVSIVMVRRGGREGEFLQIRDIALQALDCGRWQVPRHVTRCLDLRRCWRTI